jgi:hypothetical protein
MLDQFIDHDPVCHCGDFLSAHHRNPMGFNHSFVECEPPEVRGANEMLDRVRASLKARLEGQSQGGDIVIMQLVDEIVEKEASNPGWWGKFAARLHKEKRKFEEENQRLRSALTGHPCP